jgi:hypothetical protein
MSDSNLDTSTVSRMEWVVGLLYLTILGLFTLGSMGMLITGYVPDFLR